MYSPIEPHRAAHDAFNRRDWDQLRSVWAADMVFVDHPRGLTVEGIENFVHWCQEWIAGMSDARTDEAQYLDAATHSICRFRGRGINDGPLGPVDATGKQLDLPMCEVHRVQDGRLVSGEVYYDLMSMLIQLGAVEAPTG